MRPLLRDGDLLEVSPHGAPRIGELVLLRCKDFGVVHRVLLRRGERYLIKGDAMGALDGWFPRSALLGRVVGIERAGRRRRPARVLGLALSLGGGAARRLLPGVRLRWRP